MARMHEKCRGIWIFEIDGSVPKINRMKKQETKKKQRRPILYEVRNHHPIHAMSYKSRVRQHVTSLEKCESGPQDVILNRDPTKTLGDIRTVESSPPINCKSSEMVSASAADSDMTTHAEQTEV